MVLQKVEWQISQYRVLNIMIKERCVVLLLPENKNAPNCMTTVIIYFNKFMKYTPLRIYL